MDRLSQQGLVGGMTPPAGPVDRALDEEEKAYQASKRISGEDTDIKAIRASMASGKTLKDYRVSLASREGK